MEYENKKMNNIWFLPSRNQTECKCIKVGIIERSGVGSGKGSVMEVI